MMGMAARRVFFNDTATTEIYTLSLHDALPIWDVHRRGGHDRGRRGLVAAGGQHHGVQRIAVEGLHQPQVGEVALRSEEHTSELQSRQYLVCRLLLEKKNNIRSPAYAFRLTTPL